MSRRQKLRQTSTCCQQIKTAWQHDHLIQLASAIPGAVQFRTEDGRRPYSFNGLFRRLLRHCELLTNSSGETRTLYSLRHTYATAELLAGTDIHTLAKQMGTSVAMLERHYSKLTATMAAEQLA